MFVGSSNELGAFKGVTALRQLLFWRKHDAYNSGVYGNHFSSLEN
jgi:hypothetical protein